MEMLKSCYSVPQGCPCGYLSDPNGRCTCSHQRIQSYLSRISGPLMDRIDIQIEVPKVAYRDLSSNKSGEPSSRIKKRVEQAKKIQEERLQPVSLLSNSDMASRHLNQFCRIDTDGRKILKQAVDVLGLSARACHSVLRVARTIADLAGRPGIGSDHLKEAIQFRSLDRNEQGNRM